MFHILLKIETNNERKQKTEEQEQEQEYDDAADDEYPGSRWNSQQNLYTVSPVVAESKRCEAKQKLQQVGDNN